MNPYGNKIYTGLAQADTRLAASLMRIERSSSFRAKSGRANSIDAGALNEADRYSVAYR
jgi:hypothetical protein